MTVRLPVNKAVPLRDTASTFGRVSRAIHGLTALLLLGSYLLAWTWTVPGRGPLQNAMVDWHRTSGLVILLLTLLRLMWRAGSVRKQPLQLPAWNRWLAHSVQFLSYVLLVFIPVLGWAYTNAGGYGVSLFSIPLPSLVPRDKYLSGITVTVHEYLAFALLALVALHVAGALRHWLSFKNTAPNSRGAALRMFSKP